MSVPHPLDTRIRTAHAVAGIRGSLLLAPDSPASPAPAPVIGRIAPARPETPHPDGIDRAGAIAAVDAQGRVNLRKALAVLEWDAGTELVLRVTGSRATVRRGRPATPADLPVVVDTQGRLCLKPTALAALDLDAGTQVLAAAVPSLGELQLCNAAEALTQLFGGSEPRPTGSVTPLTAGRSRIRPRFVPDHSNSQETLDD